MIKVLVCCFVVSSYLLSVVERGRGGGEERGGGAVTDERERGIENRVLSPIRTAMATRQKRPPRISRWNIARSRMVVANEFTDSIRFEISSSRTMIIFGRTTLQIAIHLQLQLSRFQSVEHDTSSSTEFFIFLGLLTRACPYENSVRAILITLYTFQATYVPEKFRISRIHRFSSF